jgi:hypothetical protein
MIHKKHTCLLSAKIGTDSPNYGKAGTFKVYTDSYTYFYYYYLQQ